MKILLGWDGFPRKIDDVWIDPNGKWVQCELSGFEELVEIMEGLSEVPRASDDVSKRQHKWFNPLVLKPESIENRKRKKPDVEYLSPFICVDIDEEGYTIEKIKEIFAGVTIVAHTTTKSKPEWQRWRVVIQLDRNYSGEEYEAIWRYLQVILNGQMDEATKDYTRLSFMPARWENAYNAFFYIKAKPWSVDEIVSKAPPAPIVETFDMSTVELVSAPDGTPIITDRMVQNNIIKTGRMYKILCAAAANYKKNGWILPINDLWQDAKRVSHIIGHKETHNGELLEECKKAMDYIFARVQTDEPLSTEETVKKAMAWVKTNVKETDDRPELYHIDFFHSKYVTPAILQRFKNDRNIYKLVCSICSLGVKYGKELSEKQVLKIVEEAEKYLRMIKR